MNVENCLVKTPRLEDLTNREQHLVLVGRSRHGNRQKEIWTSSRNSDAPTSSPQSRVGHRSNPLPSTRLCPFPLASRNAGLDLGPPGQTLVTL